MTLVLRNISKSYSGRHVLKNVSFDLSNGQIVGLLGKNGVGKTTLLKIIAGLNPLESGSIDLDGLTPSHQESYQKNIGYMSERNPLYSDMYVAEYLHWVASIHKITSKSQRVNEVCEEVSIRDMSGHRIKELSKGYKQRVGLAASILHRPKLLLLDEPVNGLDPSQIIQFRKLILSLSRDRIILMSSHLMQEIEAVCHRIILLDQGSIMKDEYLNVNSRSNLQKCILVPSAPLNLKLLKALRSIEDVEELSEGTYIISYQTDMDPRKEIFEILMTKGLYIKELKNYKEELDQYFTQGL